MAIVTSEIIYNSLQGLKRHIIEKHTDQVGKEYYFFYKCLNSFDINTRLANNAIILWDRLIKIENNIYKNQMDSSIMIDPLANPLYVTKSDLLKFLIKYAITVGYPQAYYLTAVIDSLTDTQIKNIVGITQTQVNTLRSRVTRLKAIHAEVLIDNGNVEVEV